MRLAHHLRREPRAGLGVRPGVRDLRLAEPAAVEPRIDFERRRVADGRARRSPRRGRGRSRATSASEMSATTSGVRYAAGSWTSYSSCSFTVRASTRPPVFAALVMVNEPSAATSAIGKPALREIGNVLEARVGEVAAGDLRAAFEQVPGHRGAAELVPVVLGPAVVRHRRPDRERGIGDAAGDDDLRARPQRIRDRLRALVHVRAHEARSRLAGRCSREERPTALVGEIVALDDADPQAREAELARERVEPPRRGARIGGAEVADDRDAVLDASLEDRADEARRAVARSRGRGSAGARAARSRASVRRDVSKMIAAGPPRATSVATTGPAASVRSLENPAPPPIAKRFSRHRAPSLYIAAPMIPAPARALINVSRMQGSSR